MTCKETGNFCHNTEKKRSQLKKTEEAQILDLKDFKLIITNMFKENLVYIIKEYMRTKSHKIDEVNKDKLFLKEANRNFGF